MVSGGLGGAWLCSWAGARLSKGLACSCRAGGTVPAASPPALGRLVRASDLKPQQP